MMRELGIAIRMTVTTLVLTGLLYPLFMTGLAQTVFPRQANGSLVRSGTDVIGSSLVGQKFASAAYFQNRPSAAGADGYDASASSGSNLGPTSAKLRGRVAAAVESLLAQNPRASRAVPAELVTASGSGLDPDLSLEGALWQASRVAAARGIPVGEVESLVRARLQPRDLGFLGEARVNVLLLNIALDARYGDERAAGG